MTKAAAAKGHNNPPSDVDILKEKYASIFERAKKWLAKAKKVDLSPKTEDDCAKLEAIFKEGRDVLNDAERARKDEKDEYLRKGREVDDLFNKQIRDTLNGIANDIRQAAADRRLAITEAAQEAARKAAEKADAEAEKLRQKAEAQEARGDVKQADVTLAAADGVERRAEGLAAFAEAPVDQASRARHAGGGSVSVRGVLTCTNIARDKIDLNALKPYFKHEDIVAAVNQALKMGAFTEFAGAVIERKAKSNIR